MKNEIDKSEEMQMLELMLPDGRSDARRAITNFQHATPNEVAFVIWERAELIKNPEKACLLISKIVELLSPSSSRIWVAVPPWLAVILKNLRSVDPVEENTNYRLTHFGKTCGTDLYYDSDLANCDYCYFGNSVVRYGRGIFT